MQSFNPQQRMDGIQEVRNSDKGGATLFNFLQLFTLLFMGAAEPVAQKVHSCSYGNFGIQQVSLVGKFVWYDLITQDLPGAPQSTAPAHIDAFKALTDRAVIGCLRRLQSNWTLPGW